MTNMSQIPAQHPSLIVETTPTGGPDDPWVECRTCGRCNYLSRGPIGHKRGCATGAQYQTTPRTASPATLDREIAEHLRDEELRAFSRNARRTGLTKGRDTDVLEAVQKGYLSVDDAMNTDD
jgi:hypothetical protein